jgi:transcriptional regulator with PAS, ATPase and Fis domain
MEHEYPGNVRELQNILEHAFVLCGTNLIDLENLPPELRPAGMAVRTAVGPATTLTSMEKMLISEALRRHGGSRKRAAQTLGINASTLYRKIRALDIKPPPGDGRNRSGK